MPQFAMHLLCLKMHHCALYTKVNHKTRKQPPKLTSFVLRIASVPVGPYSALPYVTALLVGETII